MERKILVWVIMAAIMASQALAALQVTAFSCNGETGTVNIPNTDAFTCSATINNPDDSTASLSAVKLYIDGTWASQTYDGTGFSTSLSTGASTSVTFFDITPTTPGSHKFAYMLMDGVSDTFVADTTVNVMDIRISGLSSNVSTAASSSQFTVTTEIPIGGAMSVTAAIELSGCTLAAGETATKTLGSLTEGAQTSVSWRFVMGSGDCSYTVTATGTGSGKVTDDLSGTVENSATGGGSDSPAGGGSGGGSSGGGGGGGGGASLESESTIASSIGAGSIGTFAFQKFASIAVYEISFRAKTNLENAKLTVKEARLSGDAQKPTDSENEALYKYFSVVKEKVSDSSISDIRIRFKVPASWLGTESIKPESVALKRLVNGSWETVQTTILDRAGSYTSYEAAPQGLSIFAITGEKKKQLDLGKELEKKLEEVTREKEEAPAEREEGGGDEKPSLLDIPLLPEQYRKGAWIAGLAGLIAAAYFWWHHHKKVLRHEKENQ